MKNKIFILLFFIFILIANLSFASYSTVTMEVVEEPVCTIKIEENSKFEKKLIKKDLTNKEVTLQLQVTNNEVAKKLTGEVMIVLDNSDSMNSTVSENKTRKELIFESAKNLVSTLLKDNDSLKIGIVSFSSNPDVSKEATLEDAFDVCKLTDNATELTNAISNTQTNGARTDLDAGLNLATSYFSEDATNKYMIVLTDGVPNIALGYNNPYYSDDVITKTKKSLIDISNNGIKLFTMLTGIDDENYVPAGVEKNFGQIIKEIFGTQETPTAGNFYYISDDKIEETITNTIYNDLLPVNKTFTDFTIVDYFPKEIIDNFEFAYVTEANIGNISAEIDKTNNSITWTIPELKEGETAIVQYKLKLKEDFDTTIIDKVLDTNEKVDISYKDPDGNDNNKTSDVTPKLKLTEPEELPTELPKTGKFIFMSLSLVTLGLLIFTFIRYQRLK